MEETERQIFDVVASSLDSYVSDFKDVNWSSHDTSDNACKGAANHHQLLVCEK
jgi:hypothetical protein